MLMVTQHEPYLLIRPWSCPRFTGRRLLEGAAGIFERGGKTMDG